MRVRIFGPLEARLQTIDRVVLGGLNEGTWPPETRSDPWLSRPMRRDLGLDPPERRIGLSAHDFAQALGAPEVILSRAAKLAGAPTVTSRFVQRIAALAGTRWDDVLKRGDNYLALARALDHPAQVKAATRPAPTPPLAARPSRLSVTAIEDWLRDPYTIYARYVLRLPVLDPVDTPPGARDRGTVIHGAIGDFTAQIRRRPARQSGGGIAQARRKAFRAAERLSGSEAPSGGRASCASRNGSCPGTASAAPASQTLHAEIKGELKFPIGKREFTLSAIADRIEQRTDGSYAIIDYKTGSGAHREAGAHGSRAATDAGSRHSARRQVRQPLPPARCPKFPTSR